MEIKDNRYANDKDSGGELEAMRAQMRHLRDRLDTQQIVSDRLMRTTIEQGMRFSRRIFKIRSILLMPVGIVCMLFLQRQIGLPLWFVIFTIMFFLGAILLDWHSTRLGIMDYGTVPLLEMQRRLVRQKRLRARRMLGGMVVLAVWLASFVNVLMYDVQPDGMSAADMEDMRTGMFGGMAVGGVVGLILGFNTYLRMQRENDDAISRIRAYTDIAD